MSILTDLATELRQLKDRKEALETELKSVNKQIGVVEGQHLPTAMEDAEITKFTVEGVGGIHLRDKVATFVAKDDRDALYQELRDTGHEALVVDHVWPGTLTAWVKEQLDNGLAVPDQIKVTLLPQAILRRS